MAKAKSPAAKASEATATPVHVSSSTQKKSKFPLWVVGICGCLLLCCCVAAAAAGAYYYFNRNTGGPILNKEPIINITKPTGMNWYTSYQGTLDLAGLASDEENQLKNITVTVNGKNFNASGTASWSSEQIALNEGDNKIEVTGTDGGGNKGSDTLFVVYNKEVLYVEEPKVAPDYIYLNDPAKAVVFTAKVVKKSSNEISAVKLVKVNANGDIDKEIGAMFDDGKSDEHGDDIPGDGGYSLKTQLSSADLNPMYYRVVTTLANSGPTGMSGVVKVSVIEPISTQTADQIAALNQQVTDLIAQGQAQNQTPQQIATSVNNWVSTQPGITASGVSQQGQGVWWVYANTCIPGGAYISSPGAKGGVAQNSKLTLANNSSGLIQKVSAAGVGPEVQNTKAIYLGPYLSDFGQADDYYGAWVKVKEAACPKCEVVEKTNEQVTVEDFASLSKYGLVVISSHGDNWYGGLSGDNMCAEGLQQSQVIVYTAQKLTAANLKTYEADLRARRLGVGADNNLIILPAYISYHNSTFPNSLVYMSSCRSSYNTTMAAAFLGKGAQAYAGYDDYVLASYALKAGEGLVDNFLLKGNDFGTSYSNTLSSAGSSDGKGADFISVGNTALKMGGNNFNNVGFETGNLSNWAPNGDSRIISSLGPLKPTEGSFMAIISTGLGAASGSNSMISQSICYGKTGGTLKFDYDVISEEPMEYLNSKYDDRMDVYLVVNGKEKKILSKGVNDSAWLPTAVSIDFSGGDKTTYHTGWQTASIPLTDVATGAQLMLKFTVTDIGDSSYDTAAIFDNIRVE